MRGQRPSQPSFVSLINVETMIAADHPIRTIKRMCDEVLREMSAHFDEIYAKDGHPLPAPIKADTVFLAPGERYDLILRADDPGLWMVHDHIDRHTVNGKSPMGGIMTTIEYAEANAASHSFYKWKDKVFVPDFYYEESLKKPLGFHENPAFKGKPA